MNTPRWSELDEATRRASGPAALSDDELLSELRSVSSRIAEILACYPEADDQLTRSARRNTARVYANFPEWSRWDLSDDEREAVRRESP